ncbi:MAG: hypothetical protein WED00_11695 [Aquisalimonadaceae bacterium]
MDWEQYREYMNLGKVRRRMREIEAAQRALYGRMEALLDEFRTTFARSRPWEIHPYIHKRGEGMRHWTWRLKGYRGQGQNYVHLLDERALPILKASPPAVREIWLRLDREGRAVSLQYNRLAYELRWLRIQEGYLVEWKRLMNRT